MSKQATKALIDAHITANGTQAITGPILNNVLNTMVDDYGTQEELSQLSQKLYGGNSQIQVTRTGEFLYTNYAVGTTIDLTNFGTNPSFTCFIADIPEDASAVIVSGTGGSAGRLWAFLNHNNVLLSVADASITLSNESLQIPEGAKKVVVNTKTAAEQFFVVGSNDIGRLDGRIDTVENEVGDYQGKKNIPHPSILNGAYVRYDNGTEASSGVNSIIRRVDVSALVGKTIYYSRVRIPASTGNQGIVFYDANGTYISGKQGVLNASAWELELDSIVVPTGAVRASFTCPTSLLSNFELYTPSTISEDLLGKMPFMAVDNVPTSGSENLVKSGGIYAAINPEFTDRNTLNPIFDELYITGLQDGYYFSYFTWNGTIVTAIIRDSDNNIVWFPNGVAATPGSIFQYSQNGITVYAIFNSTTHTTSPETTHVLGKALNLASNPKISEYLFTPVEQFLPLCVSRFNLNELLPNGLYNASWVGITRRCDDVNDSVFCFANKTAAAVSNKFFDLYSVGTHTRGERYVSTMSNYIDFVAKNSLPTSDALLLSLVVAAVNNADGDNLTQRWRTGGAHAYGNETTGTPTMRELSNDVRVDGADVPIGHRNVRGRVCTIDIVNNIQGYNTCKQAGGGREIIQQRAHIEITNTYVETTIEYVALEEVIVYGPLLATGMSVVNMDGYRFIGSMSKPGLYVFDGTGNVPSADDNRIDAIRIENGGYLFDTELDLSYGLGNKKENNTPNLFVTTAGKAYFEILPNTDQIHLGANECITYRTKMYLRKG